MKLHERLQMLKDQAAREGHFVRTFDVRYATEGIPEIEEDHIFYPSGSFEVSSTGDLNKSSKKATRLDLPKVIPMGAVLLVELSKSHK